MTQRITNNRRNHEKILKSINNANKAAAITSRNEPNMNEAVGIIDQGSMNERNSNPLNSHKIEGVSSNTQISMPFK